MDTVTPFQNVYCQGEIKQVNNYDVLIKGRVNEMIQDNIIYYIASAPPDYRTTYTGSGLPFATQADAFEGTPNFGKAKVVNGNFEIKLIYPNSYMVGLGSVQVPPTVYLEYKNSSGQIRKMPVKISEGIPYRSMTYPYQRCARKDATFYSVHHCLPIRKNQEQILRDSAYPEKNIMPANHWGLKPAL